MASEIAGGRGSLAAPSLLSPSGTGWTGLNTWQGTFRPNSSILFMNFLLRWPPKSKLLFDKKKKVQINLKLSSIKFKFESKPKS